MALMSLNRHTVRVFTMPASVLYSGHSASWLTYVGLEEQEKAASYRLREDAVNYAAQHTLMRCIAASALDVRPTQASEIPVDRSCQLCDSAEHHGKPRIEGISLSMARAQGVVAGAFSRQEGLNLGFDLEKMRGNYYAGFDNIALSGEEKELVAAYPQEAQNVLRLLLWTGKQAVLKATGYGLSVNPASVAVDMVGFPQDAAEPLPYRARAQLVEPGVGVQNFELSWLAYEDFAFAVASTEPVEPQIVEVATPLEVKRAIQG